jgi:hypothetical protein
MYDFIFVEVASHNVVAIVPVSDAAVMEIRGTTVETSLLAGALQLASYRHKGFKVKWIEAEEIE